RIFAADTGHVLFALKGHAERLLGARWSPDGTRVVTWSDDKTARLWDAETGHEVALLKGDGGAVFSSAFSGDGRQLLAIIVGQADAWGNTENRSAARIWPVDPLAEALQRKPRELSA